jgi:hypothetical protein
MEYISRNKCFFSRFEYHIFYVLYITVTYLLTPPCIYLQSDASNQLIIGGHVTDTITKNLDMLCLKEINVNGIYLFSFIYDHLYQKGFMRVSSLKCIA